MKKLNIGLVGYGFMGRAHSKCVPHRQPVFRSQVPIRAQGGCCTGSGENKTVRAQMGLSVALHRLETTGCGSGKLMSSILSVRTIRTRKSQSRQPQAGKTILCDKPLARNREEAHQRLTPPKKAGVRTMVWYNYRRTPAVTLAKEIIASGKLGRIFHYRAKFLQDWTISPNVPQGGKVGWRLDVRKPAEPTFEDAMATEKVINAVLRSAKSGKWENAS
jgi:hypothetical protein